MEAAARRNICIAGAKPEARHVDAAAESCVLRVELRQRVALCRIENCWKVRESLRVQGDGDAGPIDRGESVADRLRDGGHRGLVPRPDRSRPFCPSGLPAPPCLSCPSRPSPSRPSAPSPAPPRPSA